MLPFVGTKDVGVFVYARIHGFSAGKEERIAKKTGKEKKQLVLKSSSFDLKLYLDFWFRGVSISFSSVTIPHSSISVCVCMCLYMKRVVLQSQCGFCQKQCFLVAAFRF